MAGSVSPTISGNELTNFHGNAVSVQFSSNASITDNVISGGAAGQPAYSGEGISIYSSVFSNVSDNFISGFRNGMDISTASGITVIGNDLDGNVTGLAIEFAQPITTGQSL